jgi:hypothetical protein
MMAGVNRLYDEYYLRPKVAWRIVREALWDAHGSVSIMRRWIS